MDNITEKDPRSVNYQTTLILIDPEHEQIFEQALKQAELNEKYIKNTMYHGQFKYLQYTIHYLSASSLYLLGRFFEQELQSIINE